MENDIKAIEDLSLNAWPSWQIQVYDGWVLRFSHFYTHRTNCVEQIGMPQIPLPEKIRFCEEVYEWWDSPCIFKISPVVLPELDSLLKTNGYGIEHITSVMTMPLTGIASVADTRDPDAVPMLRITDRVDAFWLDTLFELKGGISDLHRRIVPNMYAAIPKDEIPVLILSGGEAVACALGILDRDAVGIYAVHVREDCRRRGIASLMIRTILAEGRKRGARYAYLQVESGNIPAKTLYRHLGFGERYSYYFRVK